MKLVLAILFPIGIVLYLLHNFILIAYFIVISVILLVVGIVLYTNKKRKEVVKALVQTEEGERRNYKIDYSALSIGEKIGQGGFGIVYNGEYPNRSYALLYFTLVQ